MTYTTKFLPDDPRLTAFALGELEGEELAAVEAALRDDPAARAAVDEIRATVAQLESAFATEAAADKLPAGVLPLRSAAIVQGRDAGKLDGGPLAKVIQFPRLKFPQLYYIAGGLAAAAFAVLVAYRPQPATAPVRFKSAEKKTYVEVALPAVTAQEAARNDQDRDAQVLAESRQLTAAMEPAKSAVASSPAPASAPAAVPAATPVMNEAPALVGQNRFVQSTNSYDRKQLAADNLQAWAAGKDDASQRAKVEPPVFSGGLGTAGGVADANSPTLPAFKVSNSRPEGYLKSNAGTATRIGMEVQRTPLKIEGAAGSNEHAYYLDANGNKVHDTGFNWDARGALVARGDHNFADARPLANTESYAYQRDNDFLGAQENPLSTFSIDVDTASYANVRRFLNGGRLPPPDAVRIEELVNYFPYHYAAPVANEAKDADTAPFAASMEVADAPWAPTHRLVRIGLKAREVSTATRAAANLVFLLDVSGSMGEPNKLPLVKESMRLLLGKLRPDDRVAIVVYAGASGLALPSTPVAKSREILEALDGLVASGGTNGGMGIQLAYDVAKANFVPGGLNRVILCTDGDFNVGVTNEGELTRLIEEKAKSGVSLTVLGFGMGNIKDSTLELLADKGNGNYGYIDSRREAEKLLVEQVNGTLVTVAKDVKLQVEFNPAQVASYRLIGYEDRLLKQEDFNNDAVAAGEIGAGHAVTALYEIVPASQVRGNGREAMGAPAVDALKYQEVSGQTSEVSSDKDQASQNRNSKIENRKSQELLTLKVRYKEPTLAVSRKREFALVDAGARFADASADFKFAAAVAEFGMILRDSPHKGTATLAEVRAWAEAGTDDDVGGYRSEFVQLVRQAEALVR
jgi:Ca-activated chloride channel family protein